ncbi:MAG: hypothetical protein LDLANPLL_02745 [Turneriella sp.]|nr:hypothetical protein [Turneriella sp.]
MATCYYDANPPGVDAIHDEKPLLLLDIRLGSSSALKGVQIKFTDVLGTTTLQGASLTTDASGRLLYPLRLERGTRTYTINSIVVDQSGSGTFSNPADLTWSGAPLPTPFSQDVETKNFILERTNFTP